MQKLISLSLLLLTFAASSLQAQSLVVPEGRTLSFSYYGDFLLHPGLKVSYEHPFLIKEKVGKKSGMPKAHVLFAVADAGVFVHPGAHTGLLLGGGAGYRKVGKRGTTFDFQLALWATHRINAGQTIEVNDGQASNAGFLAGRSYLMPSMALTFGRSLYPKRQIPLTWFVRPRVGVVLPYNAGSALLSPALETGIAWTFKSSTPKR